MRLPGKIKRPRDVAKFFTYIAGVERINFHPDERFITYGRHDEHRIWQPAYTTREADLRDKKMSEAWDVCAEYGLDVYCMAMWALEKAHPVGDGPEDCKKEKEYFFRHIPGVLDWEPL